MKRPLLIIALVSFANSAFAHLPPNDPPKYEGGKYVEVSGHNLYLDCYGKGDPTVVLWSGQGGGFLDWLLVQPEIAKSNRVCSFDPPGYGRSEHRSGDDTFDVSVDAIHSGLLASGEKSPFVLVGQSLGGIGARLFQNRYPALVCGMVLIDSYELVAPLHGKPVPMYSLSAEELRSSLPDRSHTARPIPPSTIEPAFKNLPPDAQQEHLKDVRRMIQEIDYAKEPAVMESFRSTFVTLHDASLEPDSLHGIPLLIITREGVSQPEDEIQKSYLNLSSHAERRIATGSGHFVQLDRPDFAIAAIRDVLKEEADRKR
jgi:pimeloyl-ACP methyl ester carboxylesterase